MENSIEPFIVAGIRLASGPSGVKYSGRDDLTIIEIAESSHIHCLFTRNKFCAAPVAIGSRAFSSCEYTLSDHQCR